MVALTSHSLVSPPHLDTVGPKQKVLILLYPFSSCSHLSCNPPLWESAGTGSALTWFSSCDDGGDASPCLPQSTLTTLDELFETETLLLKVHRIRCRDPIFSVLWSEKANQVCIKNVGIKPNYLTWGWGEMKTLKKYQVSLGKIKFILKSHLVRGMLQSLNLSAAAEFPVQCKWSLQHINNIVH